MESGLNGNLYLLENFSSCEYAKNQCKITSNKEKLLNKEKMKNNN